MTRRRLLAALGLAPAATLPSSRHPAYRSSQATWEQEECPGCGLVVMFLPGQRRNRCAHCGAKVRHGVE